MFYDFRQLEDGRLLKADVCIIGAGAAGITLARSFIGSRLSVCVVESGGLDYDDAVQALYEGQTSGFPYGDQTLQSSRLRYFGGTTNHWAGWCGPLGEMDFEPRSWVPYSGWPIRKADLDPYYVQAQAVCELGPYRYNEAALGQENRTFPPFSPSRLVTRFWQFSPPTRFGVDYRDELQKAPNIHVYLYANVTELAINEPATVIDTVSIRTLAGKRGTVSAKYFVLACGGIENPRLLLLSNRVERDGIGNRRDLVGRFFMEHLEAVSAQILATDPELMWQLYDQYKRAGRRVRAGVGLATEAQAKEQVLNYCASISPETGTGYAAAEGLRKDFNKGKPPRDLGTKLWTVFTDLDSAARYVYDRLRGRRGFGRTASFILTSEACEQAPNPDSRVLLSAERDALGLAKTKLDLHLSGLEKRTVRVASKIVGEEFTRLGLGRVRLADWILKDDDSWLEDLRWGSHHMGTTRMADDPQRGVVNSDCRVHSVENLYIAGSSVFPTGGYINPTLTIVALALRLGEHLKSKILSG